MTDDREAWRAQRSQAAAAHAAAAERARQQDVTAAREVLHRFRSDLVRLGVPPEPLRATAGTTRYRTGLTGWYLRRNGSLGLSVDGDVYVLTVTPRLTARFTGLALEPSDPSMQVGRGARDGESIGLVDLLALRLAELTGQDGQDG